jgi:two-component system chemotaxis sensor kinase CheA
MRDLLARFKDQAAAAGFLVLLVAFIATVLLPGYRLADQLAANTAALKLVSEQRGQPEAIQRSLGAIRDRLGTGTYVGQSLGDLAGQAADYDGALAALQLTAAGQFPELSVAAQQWSQYRTLLDPVAGFSGLPYHDSDTAGTQMNPAGRQLLADTRAALGEGRNAMPQLSAAMTTVGAGLEREVAAGAATLRQLMIAGVVFAGLLLALLGYFQWRKAREERVAREAQEQTRDILATVKDGLFLIDTDFRIGRAHSAALATLFRRDSFEGLSFEDLLYGLVPDATLATATKYVKLLWGERVNENLIKSINPLAEVEVTLDHGPAGRDTRYLEFSFHRVKGDGGVRQILVSVNDVTSRVLLARDLKESQASAAAQLDMLLGIMQVDPEQLGAFLANSQAALQLVNTILRVPARSDAEFRNKIDLVFREMHKVKGEASALGIESVESRAHAFEDLLQGLRERPELSGNDFLPLVVRLDDLLGHLKSLRGLIGKLAGLRDAALINATQMVPIGVEMPSAAATAPRDLAGTLGVLAQRVASERGRKVRLVANGLDQVPDEYLKAVQDVAIQLVRNAVVHGIEDASIRRDLGKDETGVLSLAFRRYETTFELQFEDDGAGIVADQVKATAVRRGLIGAEQAQSLDVKQSLGLIFKAGFSTHDGEDRDAGRGVGLDVVRRVVKDLGGKVAVATAPGKFTRFRIVLPAAAARQDAVA